MHTLHTSLREVCRLSLHWNAARDDFADFAYFSHFLEEGREVRNKNNNTTGNHPSAWLTTSQPQSTAIEIKSKKVRKVCKCAQPRQKRGERLGERSFVVRGHCKSVQTLHTCIKKYANCPCLHHARLGACLLMCEKSVAHAHTHTHPRSDAHCRHSLVPLSGYGCAMHTLHTSG